MTTERRAVFAVPAQGGPVDLATVLEAYVERVARLVLHASALAERTSQGERVATLRDAVARGERAILAAVRHHAPALPRERRSGLDRRTATRG
jgi:hypothetical protein